MGISREVWPACGMMMKQVLPTCWGNSWPLVLGLERNFPSRQIGTGPQRFLPSFAASSMTTAFPVRPFQSLLARLLPAAHAPGRRFVMIWSCGEECFLLFLSPQGELASVSRVFALLCDTEHNCLPGLLCAILTRCWQLCFISLHKGVWSDMIWCHHVYIYLTTS